MWGKTYSVAPICLVPSSSSLFRTGEVLQELREVNLDHRGCWRMHVLFYGRWGPVSRAVRLDDQDSGKAVVELRFGGFEIHR